MSQPLNLGCLYCLFTKASLIGASRLLNRLSEEIILLQYILKV